MCNDAITARIWLLRSRLYILVPWNFDNFEIQIETEYIGLSEHRQTYLASDRPNYPRSNAISVPDRQGISAQIEILQIETYAS